MTDYIKNKKDSIKLAYKIQKYWHDKGHPNVRCWVETFNMGSNEHASEVAGARDLYAVRSNITFAEPA